ncbi:Crp/Fnr family transcriptional regulator [bacterium]|nr:Crp/Fnr family transcriptional regulator [bacterium]
MGAQPLALLEQPIEKQHALGVTAWNRSLQAGETLFLEGETPTALYQVEHGCVKLTWNSPGGRETISELLLPGDVFDLPSCLDGCPYPLTCKAPTSSPAGLWVASRGALLEDPQLAWRCHARLAKQLRQQRSHPVAAAAERVEVRLTRALLRLAERLGTSTSQGLSFPLWLTRQELAEWVGTTPETVIRICSHLRRRGLIEMEKGLLTLIQPGLLLELTEAA